MSFHCDNGSFIKCGHIFKWKYVLEQAHLAETKKCKFVNI